MKYITGFIMYITVLTQLSNETKRDINLEDLYWSNNSSSYELLNCRQDSNGIIDSCKLAGFTYYDQANKLTNIMILCPFCAYLNGFGACSHISLRCAQDGHSIILFVNLLFF